MDNVYINSCRYSMQELFTFLADIIFTVCNFWRYDRKGGMLKVSILRVKYFLSRPYARRFGKSYAYTDLWFHKFSNLAAARQKIRCCKRRLLPNLIDFTILWFTISLILLLTNSKTQKLPFIELVINFRHYYYAELNWMKVEIIDITKWIRTTIFI